MGSDQQYIASASRMLTAFRSSFGRIHIASAELDGTEASPTVPPLTAAEARGLALRLNTLADELDQLET